jgi:hypothetical protein
MTITEITAAADMLVAVGNALEKLSDVFPCVKKRIEKTNAKILAAIAKIK